MTGRAAAGPRGGVLAGADFSRLFDFRGGGLRADFNRRFEEVAALRDI
jgi:hypothetical protein